MKRTFLCTKEGGCRLSDLELILDKGQTFQRDSKIAEGSRSIRAALKAEWIKDITE